MEYKQGKRIMGMDGIDTTNDMYHENSMLSKENQVNTPLIIQIKETDLSSIQSINNDFLFKNSFSYYLIYSLF